MNKTMLRQRRREILLKGAGRFSWSLVRLLLLCGLSFILLYPLLTKLTKSFMPVQDIYDVTVRFIPRHPTLTNYRLVSIWMELPGTMLYTLGLCGLVGICQTVSSTVVAYGFARYRFRGGGLLFAVVILAMMLPPDILLVPLYLQFQNWDLFGLVPLMTGSARGLNLTDGPIPFVVLGLTGTGIKNGLYIFLMRQYFMGLPKELEEAAYVDGGGPLKTFVHIMLPSSVPMMVTVFLFSFVWQWLDILYTSVFFSETKVMATALTSIVDTNSVMGLGITSPVEVTLLKYAGIVLTMLPLILLYLVCQRFFVQGIERSGLVG